MKELYRKNQWVLVIFDMRNYAIYDHTKPRVNKETGAISYKYSYFGQPAHAITELSRRLANEACHDLASWVESLHGYQNTLVELLSPELAK